MLPMTAVIVYLANFKFCLIRNCVKARQKFKIITVRLNDS